ncbi:hypothetical protein LINPERHAP2_LOCUS11814 [Linum perenne]
MVSESVFALIKPSIDTKKRVEEEKIESGSLDQGFGKEWGPLSPCKPGQCNLQANKVNSVRATSLWY